ncbi:MAG: NUDIX hydrolase [Archaeoglobaceae archaeon]|nr:NUDIX hydrolase [Archaeoglobaceae archaeon]HDD35921.1 NUDIX domain-containing protein [Archaeoglobus veneficus]
MREYSKKPLVGVGAFIVKNNKVLLVKRANEPNKGKWSIPGGVVKLGESLIDALKREIFEETGLEIEALDVACVSEEIVRDNTGIKFHYVIIDFFAKVVGGELRVGSDAEDAKWISFDELDEVEIVDFVKKLIDNFKMDKRKIYLK